MLLQFTVENYKSIKQEAILSMEASSDQDLPDNLAICGGSRILRSAVIFGPNAAGKSNILEALAVALRLIHRSNSRREDEELSEIVPFLFDPETAMSPTSFEFYFIASDGIKYVYGFSATQEKIVTEYLYWYKEGSEASVIFERNMDGETGYCFPEKEISRQLEPITERNTENKLFLSTATAWNAKVTKEPYRWLDHNILVISSNYSYLMNYALSIHNKVGDNSSLKTFTQQLLKEADINISDYTVSSGPKKNTFEVTMSHTVFNKELSLEEYSLDMMDESDGTRNLFMLSPILLQTFDQGCTLCVDEFDASLHPLLVMHLLGMFHNPAMNQKNAQLIFTAHTNDLMSEDVLRRDQIYFVGKSHITADTELFSLDEFSKIENEDRRKAYMLGDYGAVPELGWGEIKWQ